MRGRRETQSFTNKQKLDCEESSDNQPRLQVLAEHLAGLLEQHHRPPNQDRRKARADCNLHEGCHIRCGDFENDLLEAPDEAKQRHDRRGLKVEGFAFVQLLILEGHCVDQIFFDSK